MFTKEPKKKFALRGLTTQLFGFVILPLTVLLLLVAFGGLSLHQEAMRALVAERDERAVRAAAGNLDEQIAHRATAIRTLSLRVRDGMDPEDLQSLLNTANFPPPEFEHGLAFLARGGVVLASTGDASFWDNFDPSSEKALQENLIRDVPSTFILLSHPVSENPVMFVTAPSDKGGPIAVGAFSPSELAHRAMASVFTPGENSVAFMVGPNSELLYQVGAFFEGETPATHAGVPEALAGNSGANYVAVENSEHVIAYSPISTVGWALVMEEPWESVTSPLLRTTENAPLVLVPVLLMAIIALWFGIRQIVQPLQSLGAQAAEVGKGNFDAITDPVGGIEEIQRLQSELVRLSRRVQASQMGLRGYIGAMTTGQEEERRRLARELHDDTLQALIALNQRVQLTRSSVNGEGTDRHLSEIQTLTTQTIANLRRITRALRPIYLEELGLVAALEALVQETQQASNLETGIQIKGTQRRFSAVQELAFYRMAQEALNNVIRHAEASKGLLAFDFAASEVTLTISDDGKGFVVPENPADLTLKGHFGLLGLYERADLIGAKLLITSFPDKGTQITVTLRTDI